MAWFRAMESAQPRARRRPAKNVTQRDLRLRTWGGRRAGAGRKPAGPRANTPHSSRPVHAWRHPVHLTLRAVRGLPSLRKRTVFGQIRRALARCSSERFRVLHFSVQDDHIHLLVEADDKMALSCGATGLAIRLARTINRVLDRAGRVWGDRYHARALFTPREVRHGLVYVLTNWRKHVRGARGLDACASGFWFDGWRRGVPSTTAHGWNANDGSPVASPQTWLGAVGWRRHGLIGLNERPKFGLTSAASRK